METSNRSLAMKENFNYTEEEVSILVSYLRESVSKEGFWGTGLSFIQSLRDLQTCVKVEPWVGKVLRVPFKKLPCYLNSGKIKVPRKEKISDDTYFINTWVKPIVVWRLQIGK